MLVNDTPAARALRARIYNALPAATFQMEKLLGLAEVVVTTAVPSAAVECSRHPRLLVNPDFVADHCRTDEHLLLLVLHELHHVILGHTRLFPCPTPAHNLAFDAVINALLCRQFPQPEHVSFFQSLNPWESFPSRLLRPPPGWPAAPESLPADASARERSVHRRLYADGGEATYQELFELLVPLLGAAPSGAVLLGDHSGDEAALRNPTLRDVVRRIVEQWPPPPGRGLGRDSGRDRGDWFLLPGRDPARPLRDALRRLLARAGLLTGSGRVRHPRAGDEALGIDTVLPQPRDRRAWALTRLRGAPPLLWRGTTIQRRVRPRPAPVAHAYLDVSGSMSAALPALAAVLSPLHRAGALKLFVFSTVIDEVRPGDLRCQKLRNTGGTDIACVLEHLAALPPRRRPRRTVLVTDGWVGQVPPAAFSDLHVELFVGLWREPGLATANDLAAAARHVEQLPTPA